MPIYPVRKRLCISTRSSSPRTAPATKCSSRPTVEKPRKEIEKGKADDEGNGNDEPKAKKVRARKDDNKDKDADDEGEDEKDADEDKTRIRTRREVIGRYDVDFSRLKSAR